MSLPGWAWILLIPWEFLLSGWFLVPLRAGTCGVLQVGEYEAW